MTERKPLPLSVEDFKELMEDGYAYVDKSLLIHELISTRAKAVLLPRMRRCGKTLNMSMLRYFFEQSKPGNAHLFKQLAIKKKASSWAHQGRYPVIFITLKDVQGETFKEAMDALREVIADEFVRHDYLLDSPTLKDPERRAFEAIYNNRASPQLYRSSLKTLSRYLHRHYGQKVVMLIDEYDAPMHNAYTHGYYSKMVNFIRPWLSGGFKTNTALQYGVVTGILRVAKESIFSGLNNIIPYTMFDNEFSDKFGFLEHEVAALLKVYGLPKALAGFRRWYNGYRIGNTVGVYNPWSVLRCIAKEGHLGTYWKRTSGDGLVKKVITEGPPIVKTDLEILLSGGTITKRIDDGFIFSDLLHDDNVIWSLLLYSGYLTLAAPPPEENEEEDVEPLSHLRIPNAEVRRVYTQMVREWFEKRSDTRQQYCQMLDAVASGDVQAFEHILQQFLLQNMSFLDGVPKQEWLYHVILLAMLVGLSGSHQVRSNREAGLGRYDIMVQPNDKKAPGMVMEFKYVEKPKELEAAAAAALKQCASRRYAEELRAAGIKRIIEIGVGVSGKQVAVTHRCA